MVTAVINLWKATLGRIPKGQDQIWWLIKVEGKPWIQAISPVLFFGLFWFVFSFSTSDHVRVMSMTLALLIHVWMHEQGHAFVFRVTGIKCHVWWLFPLGAVAAPLNREEDARSDRLPWYTMAWLLQAGLTVNIAIMIVGLLLQVSTTSWLSLFGQDLVSMGGMIAILNLLPVWQLDASLLFNVIFSSLPEEEDRQFTVALTLFLLAMLVLACVAAGIDIRAVLLWILLHIGWVVVFLAVIAGVWHRQGLDKPEYAKSTQAMTKKQAIVHIAYYSFMLFVALWLVAGSLGF